jgi:hypothetical protein
MRRSSLSVRFSCVVDKHPRFTVQAWAWFTTLRHVARRSLTEIVFHVVEGMPPDRLSYLRGLGAEVRTVPRFDVRHPCSNKLAQLHSLALAHADRIVLTDCDLAFAGRVDALFAGRDAVAAKRVDTGKPHYEHWKVIFAAAGFSAPGIGLSTHTREATYIHNFNGGVYVLTQSAFRALGGAWPWWNRWLLDRPQLLGRREFYTDQVSFGLAVHELGLPIRPLSSQFNFPTQHPNVERVVPTILHYHRRVDEQGFLLPHGAAEVDAQIAVVNGVLGMHKRTAPPSEVVAAAGRA